MNKNIIILLVVVLVIVMGIGILTQNGMLTCNYRNNYCRRTKENFTTPNFIQVLPSEGSIPLVVTFAPIYKNEFSPFMIDFGDGSKMIKIENNEIYEHTYMNLGTYNGMIYFSDSDVRQGFKIVVS